MSGRNTQETVAPPPAQGASTRAPAAGPGTSGTPLLAGLLLLGSMLLAAMAYAQTAAGKPDSPAPCADIPPADLRRICAAGRLAVARYHGQRPPFFSRSESGEWAGFDIDLARDISRRLGVDYQQVLASSFNDVVDRVASRAADIGISKLSATLERSKRVRFSRPYMTVYQTLLVNRLAAPKQQDPYLFLNRPEVRLGALEGSSYMEYASSEFASAEVIPFSDFARMMLAVTGNQLDAVFVDSARANTWRRDNPERLIQVRAFVARDRKDLLAVAVHWEDTHLLAWLDLYLDSIRDDGSADRLYRKWFVDTTD